MYPGVIRGFHNDSTMYYNEAAAESRGFEQSGFFKEFLTV